MTIETTVATPNLRWRPDEGSCASSRLLPEEIPVAVVHDASTTAVMMATPADLEDFGAGFSLSEGIIDSADDIRDLEVYASDVGIEVRLWLVPDRGRRLAARRRLLAGPTGCGLCGIESLEEAIRPVRRIADGDFRVTGEDLLVAMASMEKVQRIGQVTRAVHAAGLWRRGERLVMREDVGRHNALDKLIGAVVPHGDTSASVLLLTSRVSVEMVQKAAVLGAPVICAVSAPTALAVRTAQAAGLTLVGVTRADGFEVFTHARRVQVT